MEKINQITNDETFCLAYEEGRFEFIVECWSDFSSLTFTISSKQKS